MSIEIPVWRAIDALIKFVQLKAVYSSLECFSEQLRKAVCTFQLEYTNYHFGASRAHRAFKEKFKSCADESHEEYRRLHSFLESGLKKLCGDHADGVRQYFNMTHRHRELPRVGIHGITDDEEIIDMIVVPSLARHNSGTGKRAADYSALQYVLRTGLPYFANSVPANVKSDAKYQHGGLDVDRIRKEYRNKMLDRKLFARWRNNILRETSKDELWNSMASTKPDDVLHMYKSHVIVPITYRAHADRGRLDANLVDVLGLLDDGRAILGLLVVDHPAAYYFDDGPATTYENTDINVLYVFADMLSLILTTQFMYTIGSQTVTQYEERFGGDGDAS